MTLKRTSAARSDLVQASERPDMRVVVVTMDSHLASATERASVALAKSLPGLRLTVHAAAQWGDDSQALQRCNDDIAQGDIIIVAMLIQYSSHALKR